MHTKSPRYSAILGLLGLTWLGCQHDTHGANDPSTEREDVEVRQIKPTDDEMLEQWVRVTDDEDNEGVSAFRVPDQTWRVEVRVAEFIRSEPLASALHAAITDALRGLPNVTQACREAALRGRLPKALFVS